MTIKAALASVSLTFLLAAFTGGCAIDSADPELDQTDDAVTAPSGLAVVSTKLKPDAKAVTVGYTTPLVTNGKPVVQAAKLVVTASETISRITAVRSPSSQAALFNVYVENAKGEFVGMSGKEYLHGDTQSIWVSLPKGTYYVFAKPTVASVDGQYALTAHDDYVAGVTASGAWLSSYTAKSYQFSPGLSPVGLGGPSSGSSETCAFAPATMKLECRNGENYSMDVGADGRFTFVTGTSDNHYWTYLWIEGRFLSGGRVFLYRYTHNSYTVAVQGLPVVPGDGL